MNSSASQKKSQFVDTPVLDANRKSTESNRSPQRAEISNEDYDFIRDLVYKETRINLGDHKRELVTARLGKRVRALGLNSSQALLQHDEERSE